MKIALISCTKLKQDHPTHAANMYMPSQLFRKARAYISPRYLHWYILSAKYGLLIPNQWIEPYNQTLNNTPASLIKEWATLVAEDIIRKRPTQVDFYAGEKYRKHVIPILEANGIKCTIPLKGLGIGQQLQFYTKQKENTQ